MSNIYFLIPILIIINCETTEKNPNTYTRNITNYTSYFINSTIPTLNEKTFDKEIQNKQNDYLILFTVKKCLHCNDIIKITEEVQKLYSKKNETIKFYKLDCFMSGWVSLRFELTKVPMFFYITNGVYAGYKAENYTKDGLIEFIEDKHKDYKSLPDKLGYIELGMKIFHILSKAIKRKISFWNEGFSLVVLIAIIIFFLYFEYNLYKDCCRSINNKNQKVKGKETIDEKTTHNHLHNN